MVAAARRGAASSCGRSTRRPRRRRGRGSSPASRSGIKPANGLFLFAPARRASPLVRRWRAGVAVRARAAARASSRSCSGSTAAAASRSSRSSRILLAAGAPVAAPEPAVSWLERLREFVPLDRHAAEPAVPGLPRVLLERPAARVRARRGRLIAVARRSVPNALFLAALARRLLRSSRAPRRAVSVETGELLPAADARVPGVLLPGRVAAAAGAGLGHAARRAVRRAAAGRALAAAGRRRRRGRARSCPLVASAALPPSDGTRSRRSSRSAPLPPGRRDFGLDVDGGRGRPRPHAGARRSAGARTRSRRLPLAVATTSSTPSDPRVIREGILCEPTEQRHRCTHRDGRGRAGRGGRAFDRPGPRARGRTGSAWPRTGSTTPKRGDTFALCATAQRQCGLARPQALVAVRRTLGLRALVRRAAVPARGRRAATARRRVRRPARPRARCGGRRDDGARRRDRTRPARRAARRSSRGTSRRPASSTSAAQLPVLDVERGDRRSSRYRDGRSIVRRPDELVAGVARGQRAVPRRLGYALLGRAARLADALVGRGRAPGRRRRARARVVFFATILGAHALVVAARRRRRPRARRRRARPGSRSEPPARAAVEFRRSRPRLRGRRRRLRARRRRRLPLLAVARRRVGDLAAERPRALAPRPRRAAVRPERGAT